MKPSKGISIYLASEYNKSIFAQRQVHVLLFAFIIIPVWYSIIG
uniref:Uncharacterized protein n=1 Tax=Anguilla anguilla TaxID=7936 RepID=A0A0E9WYQ0_ANGAN